MNKKQEIIRGHLTCTCDEAYKSRNMTDPNCFLCEYESEIELMMQEYAEQQLKNRNLQNVKHSANFHAKAIIKKLTSRPHLEDDEGYYDMIADEIQMIEIVEKYLEQHYR